MNKKLIHWEFLIFPSIFFLSVFFIKDVEIAIVAILPSIVILLISAFKLLSLFLTKSSGVKNKKHYIFKQMACFFIALVFLMRL